MQSFCELNENFLISNIGGLTEGNRIPGFQMVCTVIVVLRYEIEADFHLCKLNLCGKNKEISGGENQGVPFIQCVLICS